ncbi:hypothetical protein NE237_001468 [Protea cynaroides]|uniref:Pentatricopeptide repeat-containing protein n=1 Tax=Protea cynaroides TaxID=273540 RepID=A0A9Q0QYE9_9MAGN|nr:hypothetical protein NE237_001468 [Protea cynaroides]
MAFNKSVTPCLGVITTTSTGWAYVSVWRLAKKMSILKLQDARHHRSALLFSTASFLSLNSHSDALLSDKAYTLLKRYPNQLDSLSPHFTPQAASLLLLKSQFDQTLTLKFLNWARSYSFFDVKCKCLTLHILTRFKLYKTAQSLAEVLVTEEDDCSSVFVCLNLTYHICSFSSSVFDLLVKSCSLEHD